MRSRSGASIVVAALVGAMAHAAPAAAAPRAAIVFTPDANVIAAHPELSLGLVSPTLGGYSREQIMLDIGQGARISARAYTRKLPPLESAVGSRQSAAWEAVVRRARDAPGDVVPGLLASTIERAGGTVAYVGVAGGSDVEALAATDETGGVGRVSLGPAVGFGARAVDVWGSSSLLVVRLPAGSAGASALTDLLRARRPGDLVAVVEAPPARGLRLLSIGVIGPGVRGGVVRSGTTRRDGLVAATDISATVLQALGIREPKKMQGEPIESRAGHGAGYIRRLKRRLDAILPHRDEAVRVIAVAWAAFVLVLWLARRRLGLRDAARVILLGALWLPALALLTAAIEPSGLAEALVLALGSLALGALTDRLLPWPAAPLVPAAVTFGAHAVDLALGSHLTGLSIAGPNPKGGSRFFGIGNELEVILAVTVLVGTGAALTLLPERLAPRAFAASCVIAAVVVGAGRLGADVGGVLTLAAGGAAAAVMSLPRGPTRREIVLAVLAPLLGVAALVALDLAIGGGAHLTRTLSASTGPGDLGKVLVRRWRLSVAGLNHGTMPFTVGICVALLGLGAVRWRRLLAPLQDARLRAFRAGIVGSFFAVVVGALANDSGPVVVMIGTVSLLLLTWYVQSGTEALARPGAGLTSAVCA